MYSWSLIELHFKNSDDNIIVFLHFKMKCSDFKICFVTVSLNEKGTSNVNLKCDESVHHDLSFMPATQHSGWSSLHLNWIIFIHNHGFLRRPNSDYTLVRPPRLNVLIESWIYQSTEFTLTYGSTSFYIISTNFCNLCIYIYFHLCAAVPVYNGCNISNKIGICV